MFSISGILKYINLNGILNMRFLITVIFIFTSLEVSANKLPLPLNDSDYRSVDENEAKLGQLLFYDPILSGNKEVACATCHHKIKAALTWPHSHQQIYNHYHLTVVAICLLTPLS